MIVVPYRISIENASEISLLKNPAALSRAAVLFNRD